MQKVHKRLAKRLLPRFEPTWTGQSVTSATAVTAVLPPVFTTADPVPTTTSTSTTQAPVQSPPAAVTTTTSSTTPVAPVVTTTSTSTTPSSSVESTTTSTSSTLATSTSASSSAPVQTTVAQQTTTSRAPTSSVTQATTPSVSRSAATFTNSKGVVITSTLSISSTPSATESAAHSSSNTGTIVGAVAGAFVGVICLIAFVSWLVRQHHKRNSGNRDDFDRQSYLRNSMMIPDEPGAGRPVIGTQAALALARNNTVGPRPPTMIERKHTYGQPSPSFHPGQVVSFEPGQVVNAAAADGSYPSPMAFASYTPPAQHHQSELSRSPSGARLLVRQPTNPGMYDHASPVGSDGYHTPSPDSYHQNGYSYPMHPGGPERGMIQSVTPFQAQQYAEITRQLEGTGLDAQDSFHPISPGNSPVAAPANAPAEQPLPNPFHGRSAMPPSLPPIQESLSRTGTPIDPNPQHAHWSYDGKGQAPGSPLSLAGLPAPVSEAPMMPPAAYTREDRPVVIGNGEAPNNANRPISYVDPEDAYGGI